eukprot:CAMPEP_0117535260 /NCGR_PEP_ID=MMETSP0784-20121206/40842_1 /TAXON_ID=39447 /ORGANISM="" /LENGTH=85 /DNA_ID=CAMNT_0005331779 /DNA_START=17 /DNA_END=275 /DNA_ORIENTATION=-
MHLGSPHAQSRVCGRNFLRRNSAGYAATRQEALARRDRIHYPKHQSLQVGVEVDADIFVGRHNLSEPVPHEVELGGYARHRGALD